MTFGHSLFSRTRCKLIFFLQILNWLTCSDCPKYFPFWFLINFYFTLHHHENIYTYVFNSSIWVVLIICLDFWLNLIFMALWNLQRNLRIQKLCKSSFSPNSLAVFSQTLLPFSFLSITSIFCLYSFLCLFHPVL